MERESSEKLEAVNPEHYRKGKIEPWDFVIDQGLGYLDGTCIKYLSRWRHKNGLEDLLKARAYLNKLIAQQEPEQK